MMPTLPRHISTTKHGDYLYLGCQMREYGQSCADAALAAAGAAPVQAGWISVKDKMPDSGLTVLACYKNSGQLIRRVRAMWVAAKSVESGCDSYIGEYDEESDTYYDPEGWYEKIDNWEEFTALMIDHPVTHWMPLPSAPKEQTP